MIIDIVDYGLGNLLSVSRAIEFCGATVRIVTKEDEILNSEKLILPGVGAFADGMKGLTTAELVNPIKNYLKKGKPFLGICLGMQMLFESADEFGFHKGLGVIEGNVTKIPNKNSNGEIHKIPHIGWGMLSCTQSSGYKFKFLEQEENYVYFVHSYQVQPKNQKLILATTDYNGINIVSMIQKENVFGVQFHPEKSGECGLQLLSDFIKL